jgi:hypothetical protein
MRPNPSFADLDDVACLHAASRTKRGTGHGAGGAPVVTRAAQLALQLRRESAIARRRRVCTRPATRLHIRPWLSVPFGGGAASLG